ncbi:c(7)-type cytochrome triheme domain-containing protein [uncultured Desulfuromusa sp.]|uniref:c(7)-type cytochrome triheme domain-containing protein n=1 Tax=uncultured Desulfuromusa sp. TaxID=219183 RepID=UPI002AA6A0D5|nr:c(7)-type cytochrome triheme domain-containing protein [uncultured Desulfuromusa sp.]
MKATAATIFSTVLLIAVFIGGSLQESRAIVIKSYQYGDITMQSSGADSESGTVIFRHWTHRDKYTCRLCHVDLEFSQIAGETDIVEEDNQAGRYCGACHNGKEAFTIKSCTNCHAKDAAHLVQTKRAAKKAFYAFQKTMPRAKYGNKIDWMKAEEEGLIQLKDQLPGISMGREDFITNQRDEPLEPSLSGLPNIIFSHSKHVAWNGCGMCHPEPFKLKNGTTEINMQAIIDGNLCGRCHRTVAFQVNDCSLCHSKPVSM